MDEMRYVSVARRPTDIPSGDPMVSGVHRRCRMNRYVVTKRAGVYDATPQRCRVMLVANGKGTQWQYILLRRYAVGQRGRQDVPRRRERQRAEVGIAGGVHSAYAETVRVAKEPGGVPYDSCAARQRRAVNAAGKNLPQEQY